MDVFIFHFFHKKSMSHERNLNFDQWKTFSEN